MPSPDFGNINNPDATGFDINTGTWWLISCSAFIAFLKKVRYAQCPMPNAQCPMPNALCPMPYALCPMPNALCPMPYALCRSRTSSF